MEFATLSELRTEPSRVWKKVAEGEDMVITRRGRSIALLVRSEPSAVHDTLRALRASVFESALRQQHRHAVQSGLDKMTIKEIKAEMAAAPRRFVPAAPAALDIAAPGSRRNVGSPPGPSSLAPARAAGLPLAG